ncbi:ATP-binding protein [Actinomadura barringtoniae]|uniref:ATP-binding protein n=1 Tax=Actinomadura barringtoniae TaxID=1427535 RepID=A0A939PHM6_9ACTN|nr:ATP-binding protein [Actinomadura barringtoniae]MBO2448711.1 ATP-binding protein [Actinomadura barringtoniae]
MFASITVPAHAESVKQVRDWVGGFNSWGFDSYVARLAVSELVTNAVRHTSSSDVTIRIGQADSGTVVEVLDGSPVLPVARPLDETAVEGRGLAMLGALVKDWGAQPLSSGGKAVWALLPQGPK